MLRLTSSKDERPSSLPEADRSPPGSASSAGTRRESCSRLELEQPIAARRALPAHELFTRDGDRAIQGQRLPRACETRRRHVRARGARCGRATTSTDTGVSATRRSATSSASQGTAKEKDEVLLRPKVSTMVVSFNLVSDVKRQAKGPFSLDQGRAPTTCDWRLRWRWTKKKARDHRVLRHRVHRGHWRLIPKRAHRLYG